MADDDLGGIMGLLAAVYFALGLGSVIVVTGVALWPIAVAVGAYVVAHGVSISVSAIYGILKSLAAGKSAEEAALETGVDITVVEVIVNILKTIAGT